MNRFAKKLGVFIASIFFVVLPLITGLRLGTVGELEWFTLLGLIVCFMEIGILAGELSFIINYGIK